MQQYFSEETVNTDESIVPCFERHGCRQFMRSKPVNFGYRFWVAATYIPIYYSVLPYMEKDENYNPSLGLGGSGVRKLSGSLSNQDGSKHHIVMPLLRLLKELGTASTGTVSINCVEKTPLKSVKERKSLREIPLTLPLKIIPILPLSDGKTTSSNRSIHLVWSISNEESISKKNMVE